MLITLAHWLSLALAPLLVVCVIDDWFLRPARQKAALPGTAGDSPLMRVLYLLLAAAVIASIYRLMTSEDTDYSLVLFGIMVVSGVVWLVDALFLRKGRMLPAGTAVGGGAAELPEPGTVDYARSFFPVAAILLVLRAFVFEPYRIPTDSMMPTLLAGDFIVVNKFAYGLRLPVTQRKIADTGLPQRGDIVVFRFPPDPRVNYIKRLVGLPGDHIQVKNDQLIVNDSPVPMEENARYSDGCYLNMRQATEQLAEHRHQVLHCVTNDYIQVAPLPGCNRKITQNYICNEAATAAVDDLNNADIRVPQGKYLMIGDNRDNSADGRVWGFVDETQLVGKATRIWFNWDLNRSGGPNWSRIGTKIE